MQNFLNQSFFGNSVTLYLTAIGTFILCFIIIKIFKKILISRLKVWAEKTKTTLDDFLIQGIENTAIPLLYFGGFYLALHTLNITLKVENIIRIASLILVTFFSLKLIVSTMNYSLSVYLRKKGQSDIRHKEIRGITTLLSILIWVLGFVFLLDNLGINVSAVIAGLGIGGIAIALAAQAVLGDLFSYFVIFLDRPFEIGDFIIVGEKMGAVEYIGIKTTRIRAIGGEQLVFSNKDLTDSRIHNYKKMERRRVVFHLGVVYQTKAEQLEEIPKIVKKIIDDEDNVTFDRGNFSSFGDFSLNFEFVYYVKSADYNEYMNRQENMYLKIYKEFEKRNIEFAFPTQTLFLNKEDSNSNPVNEPAE